jgi:O-antigen biosynthesis protein
MNQAKEIFKECVRLWKKARDDFANEGAYCVLFKSIDYLRFQASKIPLIGPWLFVVTEGIGRSYNSWIARYDTISAEEREAMFAEMTSWQAAPVISVLMPVYNPRPEHLAAAIASVCDQIYPHWELCIADDACTDAAVLTVLEGALQKDSRIRVKRRTTNGHICAASNTALDMARGTFVALMDHDDILPAHALFHVAREIVACPEAAIIYSDEDQLGPDGKRYSPHFKPDWNEELLLAQNYINHLGVYRTALVRESGGFREGFEGSQDHDLVLRCALRSREEHIRHIPRILYHWRQFGGSRSFSDTYLARCEAARVRAVSDYLAAKGIKAKVERGFSGFTRVRYSLPHPRPLVSLIVPTRDQAGLTRQCLNGLLQRTDYEPLEILLVDNGSTEKDSLALCEEVAQDARVRVLRYPHKFNYSAINNFAVRRAAGEIIGLINNDIDVIEPHWLQEMVAHAVRSHVGAVGAKLLYPDGTIQHAGTICGLGGPAAHAFRRLPADSSRQFGRAQLAQWISAVTAACLVVERRKYEAVGGLNETGLPVAFNDVDLCLKLLHAGLKNVYTPYASLYHLESVSRGADATPEKQARFQGEVEFMLRTWGQFLSRDPFYNPNLTCCGSSHNLLARHETPHMPPWEP